jgi:hypothetical protein
MSNIDPMPAQEPESKLSPQEKYLLAVANEIANDPTGRGYADKKPEEQAALLNEPWYDYVPVLMTPRIAVVISGIDFAPNAIKVDELVEAAPLIEKAVQDVAAAKAAKASADAELSKAQP